MSTTKGAPSSRSCISFTVSPESARFCNCCSTVCLVERTFALLLLLFPLSPHQMLASLKSLLLFTGFIGLEVRGWCEAILTLSVLVTSVHCWDMLPPRCLFHNWAQAAAPCAHDVPPGLRSRPGLMSAPTSDEGWETRSDGGCSNTRHHEHGWSLAYENCQKLSAAAAKMNIAETNCQLCSAERSAVYLASSVDGCYGWGFRWMEDCGGEWRHPSLLEIMQWQTSGTLAWLLH